MLANGTGGPSDTAIAPQTDVAEGARSALIALSTGEQQGLKLQKVIAKFVASNRPRLWGAVLGLGSLYVFQTLEGGSIEKTIGLPGISLGGLVVIGAFAGSAVFEGVANIVGAIWNALGIPYFWRLGELWVTYRMGRISPKQYFELGAVLDYHRHCGHLPPEAQPKAQADFVREAVRWRMDSKRKRGARKKGSRDF